MQRVKESGKVRNSGQTACIFLTEGKTLYGNRKKNLRRLNIRPLSRFIALAVSVEFSFLTPCYSFRRN